MNATSDKPTVTPKEFSFALESELYDSLSAVAIRRGKPLEAVAKELLRESLAQEEENERRFKIMEELTAYNQSLGLYD